LPGDNRGPRAGHRYGVGRIGCHVAGDHDWGTITDVPWGVASTKAIIGWVASFDGRSAGPRVQSDVDL